MNGYRAQTLEKLLTAKDKFSFKDFQQWQLDFFCPPGLEMAQFFEEWLLAADITLNKSQNQIIQLLIKWDGQLTADSIGGTVYQVLKQEIIKCWMEDKRSLQGRVSHKELPLLTHTEFFGHDTVALLRLLKETLSLWWKGDREKMLLEAIDNTHTFLIQTLGENSSSWKWGSLHVMTAEHALSVQKPLDEILNNGGHPIGGDTHTLCQIAPVPNEEYDEPMEGASYRQIIDMGNLNNSLCIAPVGQSGNSQSPHYADQMPLWIKGAYKPMLWDRTQIEQQAKYKMTIKPN